MSSACDSCDGKDFKKCLKDFQEKGIPKDVSMEEVYSWLFQKVDDWVSLKVVPSDNAKIIYVLKLSGFLSENEERFNQLNKNNFFIRLIRTSKANNDFEVNRVYTKMLSSILKHTTGVEWMLVTTFWEDILTLALDNTEYSESSARFLANFLNAALDLDKTFVNEVIKRIMEPLSSKKHSPTLDNLKPTLKLIVKILEILLEDIYLGTKDIRVPFLFLKNFHSEERIFDCMLIAQEKMLAIELSKIVFVMQFLELYGKMISKKVTIGEVESCLTKIKGNFSANYYQEDFFELLDYCRFGLVFWNVVEKKSSNHKLNEMIFNEVLLVLTQALFYSQIQFYNGHFLEMEEFIFGDDLRSKFCTNFMKSLAPECVRVYYYWRDRFESIDLWKLAITSLKKLSTCYKFIGRDQAVTVCKMFIYSLADVIDIIRQFPDKVECYTEHPDFILQMLEGLKVLNKKFDISLKDGVEITYVLNIAYDLLAIMQWPTKITVSLIDLIDLAIEHYMTPDMALLIENSKDSQVNVLGPTLFRKLQDERAAIQKISLEVVCTASRISKKQFPSLQKVLMDSELPTLVVKMSASDSESYVRATAIKCLQEMVQVEEIWNNALQSEDLPQKMRHVLLNETEGIVRVEAAAFMCVAYEHHQLPKDTLDAVYETMIHSSCTDLHWEVKVRALDFWDKVIKTHLQHQGMIDGSFPNVTFSKEHRKIVTLTDAEIRKRLMKVLGQLSTIGCLGVLTSAIKDDCDVEVSKAAVRITQRLVDLFKKYNLNEEGGSTAPTSPSGTISTSSGVSVDESLDSTSQPEFNEDVVEQIVNSKDITLLKNCYTPSEYGSVSNYDIQVRKIVSPTEFLRFTQQDLNAMISEKKKWLNGIEDLGSLLDDMLKTYDEEVNNMDCY